MGCYSWAGVEPITEFELLAVVEVSPDVMCVNCLDPFQVTTALAPHNSIYVVLSYAGRGRLCRSR